MSVRITVYFIDGTPTFEFGTTEEAAKKTALKIFREGFVENHKNGSTMYHSPNNIKKVEVRPGDK